MEIPTIYQVLLLSMGKECYRDRTLPIFRARRVLTFIHRIPHNKVPQVLRDMRKEGFIEVENHKYIKLMAVLSE